MYMEIHYHLSEEGAKQTIQNLPGKSPNTWFFKADLKDVSAINELFLKKLKKQVGFVSVLFNNAAEFSPTPLFPKTEEEWDKQLGLNLKALFFL